MTQKSIHYVKKNENRIRVSAISAPSAAPQKKTQKSVKPKPKANLLRKK